MAGSSPVPGFDGGQNALRFMRAGLAGIASGAEQLLQQTIAPRRQEPPRAQPIDGPVYLPTQPGITTLDNGPVQPGVTAPSVHVWKTTGPFGNPVEVRTYADGSKEERIYHGPTDPQHPNTIEYDHLAPGNITLEELLTIMPNLTRRKTGADLQAAVAVAQANLPYINKAMVLGGMTTPAREAAFLATVSEETGELGNDVGQLGSLDEAGGSQKSYAPYFGRGYIQITNDYTYRDAQNQLNIPGLLAHPEEAADPDNAARIAAWFWTKYKGVDLNTLADKGTEGFTRLEEIVNGGDSNMDVRLADYRRARDVLGYAGGGTIGAEGDVRGPGSSIGDSIPAFLSDGEFVVNATSAGANRPLLKAINDDPLYMTKYLQQLEHVVAAALTKVKTPNSGRDRVDQSMTVHISAYDVHEAFAGAKLWEQRRALADG